MPIFATRYPKAHAVFTMNATKANRFPQRGRRICGPLLLATTLVLGPRPSVRAQSYIYEQLYAFAGDTNGYGPAGALIQGADGYLYGTCAEGGQPTTNCGACGYGTVFKTTTEGALTTLAWFNGTNNGRYPFGGMILATDGNFYGTSDYGIFRTTPTGTLTGRGGGTVGDPIQGSDGYLYYADGDTIFRSSLDGLAGMQWSAPGTPSGGLFQASDGNFYGLTYNGGAYGLGTAYKLTPSGVLSTLVSFGPISNAPIRPYGKLLQASDGNLYGVADTADGVVFRLTLTGALTNLAWFGVGEAYGGTPNGGLIEANDGNFYGTTAYGGGPPYYFSMGTVFKMTPQGKITTLVSFTGTGQGGPYPGYAPEAALVQGSDGNLYGTCAYGGTYGNGNIFRIIMPGPKLDSFRAGQQLVISWRTNYTGFQLQSSSALGGGNWSDCTNSLSTIGGQFFVTNSISGGAQFFRLKK